MDSLKGIIEDLRVFIYGGMRTLPLTIAGTSIILGLFSANYAIIFVLFGYLILVPIISTVLQYFIFDYFELFKSVSKQGGEVCNVVIPYSTLKNSSPKDSQLTFISPSWAMISFFLGYILTNSIKLNQMPAGMGSDVKVKARKSHTILSICVILAFFIIAAHFRYTSNCESGWGLGVGAILFGLIGWGWYETLSGMNGGRLSDVFGIANRIIAPSATPSEKMACIPTT
jgi:hypothetical protein